MRKDKFNMADYDAEVHPDLIKSLRIGGEWVPIKPGSIRSRNLVLGASGISPRTRLGKAIGFVHSETGRPAMVLASEVTGVDWDGGGD